MIKRLKEYLTLYFLSLLLFLPLLFIIIRLTIFETLPFDSYYLFVLSLGGVTEGFEWFSPTGYRWGYIIPSYLLYEYLPLIPLSKYDLESSLEKIKALQALAVVSFVSLHLFFNMTVWYLNKICEKDFILSITTSFVVVFLVLFHNLLGADPMTLAYTLFLLCLIKSRIWFGLFLVFSILINEKICILFFLFFLLNLVFSRDSRMLEKVFVSFFALLLYFFERFLLNFPGYENQTDITLLFERILISFEHMDSFKGFFLNLFPLIMLVIIGFLTTSNRVFSRENIFMSDSLIVFPFLVYFLAMFTCSDYSMGRITMHVLPFYILPICLKLEKMKAFKSIK